MLIVLSDERTWPATVIKYLEKHKDIFIRWERGENNHARGYEYDQSLKGLQDTLFDHSLHGYHCTRLHEFEINEIVQNGLTLPNIHTLSSRIKKLFELGLISQDVAFRLAMENQASEEFRANMIWFCFFEPHIGGQSGIRRFFQSWGGEALYNSHEDDPITGPILRTIGTPCIVEAEVSIASLERNSCLDIKMIAGFLKNRGISTSCEAYHENFAVKPLPSQNIRQIVKHPQPEFIRLTKCDTWNFTLN